MSLELLRKSLAEKTEALKALESKVAGDNATAEDVDALKTATAEVKTLNERYDLLKDAESERAKAAKPAAAPVEPAKQKAPAQPREKDLDTPGFMLATIMAGMAYVKGGHAANLREALDQNGFGQIGDRYEDLTQKQLQSIAGTGGILVPPTMASEIIEFLRPRTTFLQGNPRRVPLTNGTYFQAAGNTGASASYGRENSVPAYSEANFRDVNLQGKELQGKTAVSNTLLSRGVSGIRAFVDEDLRSAMGETMDLQMYLGDGTQQRPLGIYNQIAANASRAAQDSQTPTAAQVDADARWAINYLSTGNVSLAGAAWTMSQETIGFLEDMRDGNGNFLFPTLQNANPTWKRLPVLVTTNLPTNLGAGSIRSHISLVAFPHVLLGEEQGINVRVSTDAVYTDGAGQLRSAFERDETVMIAVAKHDVGLRHRRAIALLTDVRWGRA